MTDSTPRAPLTEQQDNLRKWQIALVRKYNDFMRELRANLARDMTELGTDMGSARVDLRRATIELAPLDRGIFEDADWHFRRAYSNACDAGNEEKGLAAKGSWWSNYGPNSGGTDG